VQAMFSFNRQCPGDGGLIQAGNEFVCTCGGA
jgi:hypothetical protein